MDVSNTMVQLNAVFEVCNVYKLLGKDSLFNLHVTKETWEDIKLYKKEYKTVIEQREANRIPFAHRSPQFYSRSHLINHLKRFAVSMQLTHCTLHLTVYLLDIFMDNHAITNERILLVANVCLLLAAKLEESSLTIPKIAELNASICYGFPLNDYKALEILVLRFFHWYIMFPTAAHYTHYYLQVALCKNDVDLKKTTPRILIKELHSVIRCYLDKVIEDIHYMQYYKPSKLASAIISIARDKVGLMPWSTQLQVLTNYNEIDIEETRNALLQNIPLYCKNCFNKQTIM